MKKYRIEIGLSIILFISVVVLIVNIIIKANNGGKDVTGEEKYTLPSSYNGENADELYDRMKAISDDIFKKYFIKDIGEKVSYVRTVETPGIKVVGESVENVIEEKQVNKVNYQSEYNGNIAPDGYEYIIVNITVYNDDGYKRIVSLSDMSLEYNIDWSTSSYLSDENYGEMIYREYDENMLFYTSRIISEREKKIENIVTDEDTGEIYIDAGTSVTYNAVWLIKKEHEQSLVIKKLYNKKQRYNTDYIIKIS